MRNVLYTVVYMGWLHSGGYGLDNDTVVDMGCMMIQIRHTGGVVSSAVGDWMMLSVWHFAFSAVSMVCVSKLTAPPHSRQRTILPYQPHPSDIRFYLRLVLSLRFYRISSYQTSQTSDEI
eukprot:GHVO01023329.1.p1 GENE.GHVO01023329.1~~GHVO01023329.1.p1  ORF type:complete len:120 (+),score=9.70 GHVO01023329.1:172-531(+)